MIKMIRQAMLSPENLVLELNYTDSKGRITRRTISPIKYSGKDQILALCLCREEPRQFSLKRCSNISLKNANEVLMPVAFG